MVALMGFMGLVHLFLCMERWEIEWKWKKDKNPKRFTGSYFILILQIPNSIPAVPLLKKR